MRGRLLGALALAMVGGCASMTVHTDYSPEADFSAIDSFQYREAEPPPGVSPLVHERIVAEIRDQLVASGLTEVEADADVYFTYYATIDEQLQFTTVYGGVGGWGRWGRGSIGMSTASTRASTFEEGTLVIDIWESEGEQLVWRGVISDTLSNNPERNREMVRRGITRAFESFPPGE